jgi:hypothetical protein
MRHELAYILGQMQNKIACPILSSILEKEDEDPLVRHEVSYLLHYIIYSYINLIFLFEIVC